MLDRIIAAALAAATGAGRQEGQGTVEYVALILLVAVVLAGVVAATRKAGLGDGGIAEVIVKRLKEAVAGVH
jgi:hypothetical protein